MASKSAARPAAPCCWCIRCIAQVQLPGRSTVSWEGQAVVVSALGQQWVWQSNVLPAHPPTLTASTPLALAMDHRLSPLCGWVRGGRGNWRRLSCLHSFITPCSRYESHLNDVGHAQGSTCTVHTSGKQCTGQYKTGEATGHRGSCAPGCWAAAVSVGQQKLGGWNSASTARATVL